MFSKFIRKRKGMFCNEPEYNPMLYYPIDYKKNAPVYYNRYRCYHISKYIDNEEYIVEYDRRGLMNDIQDCNRMLLLMNS